MFSSPFTPISIYSVVIQSNRQSFIPSLFIPRYLTGHPALLLLRASNRNPNHNTHFQNVCSQSAACTDKTPTDANPSLMYECVCKPGFSGDGKTCASISIDECALGKDDCDDRARADCTDTEASYTCKCKKGYVGSGTTCGGK